jgi:hypothetical protein
MLSAPIWRQLLIYDDWPSFFGDTSMSVARSRVQLAAVLFCSSQKGFQVAGEVHRVGVAVLVGDDKRGVYPRSPPAPPKPTSPKLDFGLFMRRERVHFPFGSRYGAEFLYCLGSAGT